MDDFVEFPKIARYSRPVIVTEKIDGTNAQVYIDENGNIKAGSRNRYISTSDDNYGFAKWVDKNKEELLKLGPGRHFGEWWGNGIQRGYGLSNGDKRFSLFNVSRWTESRPSCCHVVPIIWQGRFDDLRVELSMKCLSEKGSIAAPGFMNPEGIVIFHTVNGSLFKKTFKKDEGGKNNE